MKGINARRGWAGDVGGGGGGGLNSAIMGLGWFLIDLFLTPDEFVCRRHFCLLNHLA